MPDPTALARHLDALRVGARLRALEVTVEGQLERQGAELVLRLSGSGEKIRLVPLTTKVQLEVRKNRAAPPSPAETQAWQRLRENRRAQAGCVRVRGPLVRPSPESPSMLEVRDFWWFASTRPRVNALWLGVDVNGPYGLAEPWVVIRDGLKRTGDWDWLVETPDLETATFAAHPVAGRWPDQVALARQVSELGAGATLRGVEVAVEGWLSRQDGDPVLRVVGCDEFIVLAPLDRKIQWDTRHRRERSKTPGESAAQDELRARANDKPRLARVFGPLVQSQDGKQWLLEVRAFELEITPGEAGAALIARRAAISPTVPSALQPDTQSPAPPRSLAARVHHGQIVLSWDESTELDLDGYNLFRTTTPGSGYIQIAAGIVPNHSVFRAEDPGITYHYVITARDKSGNESRYSSEATVHIPEQLAPRK